jgi:disulfide bond formation protein DsbB
MCVSFKTTSAILWLAMAFILVALTASFSLEWWWHWQPCLLCSLQRIFFMLMLALLFLYSGLTTYPFVRRCIAVFYAVTLLLGLFFAVYHVTLQYVPANEATCLPNWRMMWHYMSLSQIMHVVAKGDAHCRAASMHRWLVSLPVWVVLFYLLLIVLHAVDRIMAAGKGMLRFSDNAQI